MDEEEVIGMMRDYAYDGAHSWATGMGGFSGHEWLVTGLMGFGFLLLVGLVVWFVLSQQRASAGVPVQGVPTVSAPSVSPTLAEDASERIARERLAKGEINAEEFARIIEALRG